MKNTSKEPSDELRPEYEIDYTKVVRGRYCKQLLGEGSNIVVLDADVAAAFHDSASVNAALRSLLDLTRSTLSLTQGLPPHQA
ncbi:MAG: hypothetical protein D3906_05355 [Candidatus Electrothrix sp. AUS1_2]|nr:hypothetical protein [Candidatus Electrothrix sp. AUS1_2]